MILNFTLNSVKSQHLSPLDEREKRSLKLNTFNNCIAYKYNSQDYQATINVKRIKPHISANVISFFKLESDNLNVHSEIIYKIDKAKTDKLTLSLGLSTPKMISIKGLDGLQIKEFSKKLTNEKCLWHILLSESQKGTVKIALSFQQHFPKNKSSNIRLPITAAEKYHFSNRFHCY